MSNELENHDEIRRLKDAKYSVSLVSGHLVVHDVPYLDADCHVQKGLLAAPLHTPTPTTVGAPFNHQMFWSGGWPHYIDGSTIPQLANIAGNLTLLGVHFPRHLSNKPPEGFSSYFDLVEHYVSLISGPAEELHGATARTGAQYNLGPDASVFKVTDTFSAKAELTDLNQLLAEDYVAIIGLGGTGSYLLDFMVKTPVKTIRAFDYDIFEVHNAFRSPGETNFDDFGRLKTDIYRRKYENFRHGLTIEKLKVGRTDDPQFEGVTFAFVCIDDGESRANICDMLLRLDIPFIDVGMGIELEHGKLDGLIRTTLFSDTSSKLAINEVPLDKAEEMDAYRTFVQISELNALNAAMAVIKYKQLRGFYADDKGFYQNIISLGSSNWIGESHLKYDLEKVERFPKPILPGKLYYSEEFKTSRHLCACGCGDVIKLPIDHLHHRIAEGPNGPTVRPSIGNWNVCDAHYYITNGQVEWLPKWSQERIEASRQFEDERRDVYFKAQDTFMFRFKRKLVGVWSAVKHIAGKMRR